MRDGEVFHERNTVYFAGTCSVEQIADAMRVIDIVIDDARYPNIILNFQNIDAAYGSFLTTLLSRVKYLQANRIDVVIIDPKNIAAKNFMSRANFNSIAEADGRPRRSFRPDKSLPIFHYVDADEQGHAVACIVRALLFQISGLDRRHIQAAQWALYEITDNVLNHANSLVGGFVHCQIHHNLKLIEIVVADSGIGIARSLGESDQALALQQAISEGVTRNSETNQGNGLYGTWRLATLSRGMFHIHSRSGYMNVSPNGRVRLNGRYQRYPGTYVLFQIDYSDPNLIAEALMFKGKIHDPSYDFIEEHFESPGAPHTTLRLVDHVVSTGSRDSGRKVANLINNVINMAEDRRVDIDFDGIYIVSSSFADECFGRLIAHVGPSEFFSRISFVNCDPSIRAIIDRSVVQRLKLH